MRILMLNYEFPPLGGGAGKATYNLAKELVNLGNQVDVISCRMKGQLREEAVDGFTVYRVISWRKGIHDAGFRGAFSYVFCAYFRFLSLTRKNNYDVIHYFFGLPTAFLSLLPGKHRKTPYFVSLRGSDVPNYDRWNSKLQLAHQILKPLTKKIWENASQIIAVTNSLKKTALKMAPDQDIIVTPNGVESIFCKDITGINKNINQLKLISVARLIKRKGIQDILKALEELKDPTISLLVVGTGNYENELKKMCKNFSLSNTVTFYGFSSPKELLMLYHKCDVFILPSLAEAFGNVFAEAMACSLPIIGSSIGGIPDLVDTENGILVEPGNIDEIKNAILKMKVSKKMRTRMAEANRKKILERYSWGKIAKMHLSVYQRKIK